VGPSPVYESISTMWGYTGRSSDAASGLQFNRARWYDPTIGRFISEDPSGFVGGQDTNPYRYVFNNPLVGTDPSGLALQGLSATVSSAWNNFTSSLNSAWNNLAGTISSNITNLANTIGSTISSLGHAFEGIHYTSGPSTNESEYGSGYAPSRTIVHEPAIIDGRRMAVVDVIGYRYPINDLSWDDSWEIDSYDPDYPDHLWPPPKIVNTSRWGIMKAAIGGFFSGLGEFPRFAGQQIRRGGDAFGGGLERSGVWVGQSFNRVTGLELPGVLITGGVGFVGDVVRTTGNIAGGVVDLPGTVVSTAEGLSDRYAGYRYMGLGVWDAGVMTAHPMLGMTEAYRGQSYGPTDFGRSLDLLERGTRGSLSLSATAGLTAPAANAILRRLVSVPRTYQLPTSSVVRAADGTLSLQLAPESQGVFNLTARFENVPPSMWGTFPAGVPRPTGPINLLTGDAYTAARQAANAANRPLSQGFGLGPADFQIHEIVPVKFGGSPTALSNKVGVYAPVHRQVSAWFNRLQRLMEGGN
jgi:RHS repeat-associated protein